MNLRNLLPVLLLVSPFAYGVPASSEVIDPKVFKMRFEKADINKDGKLTRQEAFAEFPRMPEFFDEIDANADGAITLAEVRRTMEKRVNAAMEANKAGKRYVLPQQSTSNMAPAVEAQGYFSSRQAAQRHYRLDYYKSIAGQRPVETLPSEPRETTHAPAQLQKKF